MIELNEQQRLDLTVAERIAIDAITKQEFALVRREVYRRVVGLLDDDTRALEPLLANLDPEDWEGAAFRKRPMKVHPVSTNREQFGCGGTRFAIS